MTVVSDASPLISLSRIGRLQLLSQVYGSLLITPQVFDEVVIWGAGLTGAAEVSTAKWIHVVALEDIEALRHSQQQYGLGLGELSAVLLGQQVNADLVVVDELKARRVAQEHGLAVIGCVGVLQDAFSFGFESDLPAAYRALLSSGAYVHRALLEHSLRALKLPPL